MRTVQDITTLPISQGWFTSVRICTGLRAESHSVLVRRFKEDGTLGETLMGRIVTYPGQSLDDYCSMHGLWLQPGSLVTTRAAAHGEVTELF